MSFTAMAWASKQKVKSSTQKLVLLMLANYADDQDKCWPSKQTLADTCCMSKTAICTSILKLQEAGFLTVEKREGTSSIIRLHTGVCQTDRGCTPRVQGVYATRTGGVRHADTNLSMNQSKEPTNESISVDSEFDEFWGVYPKRQNNPKAAAKKKYLILRKQKVSHETLVNAARKYAELRKGEDPKFTAMAVTWLNQWRFEDDYDAHVSDDTAGDIVNVRDLKKIADLYPGLEVGADDPYKALSREMKAGATVDQIREAAEKYRLLIKAQREQGLTYPLPSLGSWIRFKWREMDGYEFCRVGMNNTLAVRPKRKG